MRTPPPARAAGAQAKELVGSTTTVECADGRVTLRWREFGEGSGTRVMGLLMMFAPLGAFALIAINALDARSVVVGVLAVVIVLVVTRIVMGGSTTLTLTLTAAGVDVESSRPIIGASRRRIPAPLTVRLWPLVATADRSKGRAPTQWWVAFRGAPNCTIPGEIVLVDDLTLDALRRAIQQADLAGVKLDETGLLDDGSTTFCAGCGYDLTGITQPRCPECGRELTDWTMQLIQRADAVRRSSRRQTGE